MEHLKAASMNRHDQQHPFESSMDLMDFSMFPPDYSVINTTQVTSDNDQSLKNGSFAATNAYASANNTNNTNLNYHNQNTAGQSFLNSFTSSSDLYQSSNESTLFNSDDLIFSQQAAFSNNEKPNPINGLFNNDIYFVNGLLTPPNSDKHDMYLLPSKESSITLNTINSTNNLDANHQILSFNKDSPYDDVDYFGSSFDQLNSLSFKNPQLSSPLHSPHSGSFEDLQPFFTTTATTRKRLLPRSQSHTQEIPKMEHNAKKKTSSLTVSPSIPKISTNGVLKPSINNKRTKPLNDSRASSSSVSPSPIDYNPAVPNEAEWINVSPITDARYQEVLEMAASRKLDKKKVVKILDSFRQKHVLTKLNIINRKIGSNHNIADKNEKLARMNIMENQDNFKVICHTSSGYDIPVQESEAVPNGLRKLNILKDHVNYKFYDELASSLKSMAEQNSKNDKIKRPLNQFMLYKRSMIKAANIFKVAELIKEDNQGELIRINEELMKNPKSSILNEIVDVQPKLDHHNTCHVISLLWVTESEEVKEQFANFAKLEKDVHAKVFPNYKFNPQKRNSASK